jgi:aryl-alcohol dehydrogenase-like predicted oxidoreductase
MEIVPPNALDRFQLTPGLDICRLLNGMWQVSGVRGPAQAKAAIAEMFNYVAAGFTSWDLADHYGPAEDLLGEFLNQWGALQGVQARSQIQALTKWVPLPDTMTRQVVEANLDRSRRRMGVASIDLLQFHWWDYSNRNYIEALKHMVDLKVEGKIKHLGLTNFNTYRLADLMDRGIPIVSNQVQFSLIDQRPLTKMIPFCQGHEVSLLVYGVLCGGLLSDPYLHQPEPNLRDLSTASQQKYKRLIDAWGGWELFQQLLQVLNQISQKHQVTIANVAVRSILEQPAVAGAIIGMQVEGQGHRSENRQVFSFCLDPQDWQKIQAVLDQSQDLSPILGDCGDEYRH